METCLCSLFYFFVRLFVSAMFFWFIGFFCASVVLYMYISRSRLGGKIVGISKKTWITKFLQLDEAHDIVSAFLNLSASTVPRELNDGHLPQCLRPLEQFLCSVYCHDGPDDVEKLRWHIFRTKNVESDSLPPTKAALLPHIQRANYFALRDASYATLHPQLPEMGWSANGEPVPSLNPPAPKAILELVKCGCKMGCLTSKCSCQKNDLNCTAMCKCIRQCENGS